MTPENIEQLKKDFEELEKLKNKRSKIHSVVSRIGDIGRNNDIGKWQNQFGCKIQVALQYREGGNCYWYHDELDKEFIKTINSNFNRLLDETVKRVEDEYQEQILSFNKYKVVENEQI